MHEMVQIYDIIIEKGYITEAELNKLGFTQDEIQKMIDEETLKKNDSSYMLNAIDGLFEYGRNQYWKGNVLQSNKAYNLAYKLNPNDKNLCYFKFYIDISAGNFTKLLDYLEVMTREFSDSYNHNFYLYLLSFLIELPEELAKKVKAFSLKDILVPKEDKSVSSISITNTVRKIAYQQSFYKALNLQCKANSSTTFLIELLITSLLAQVRFKQKEDNAYVHNLIKNCNYEQLLTFYESFQRQHNLRAYDEMIFNLVKDILFMKNNRIQLVPFRLDDNIFVAIENHDYDYALARQQHALDTEKIKNDKLAMVLKDAITLRDNISFKGIDSKRWELYLDDIKSNLINGNRDKALELLREYFLIRDRQRYLPIAARLIEIFSLDKSRFEQVITELGMLGNERYSVNPKTYIISFYRCVETGDFEIALDYFNIIVYLFRLNELNIPLDVIQDEYKKMRSIIVSMGNIDIPAQFVMKPL